MNINGKKNLGSFGEEVVSKYLEQNNYQILERNYYCRQGEIDIIAKDKKEIVFIEVKTRTSNNFGSPSEAVNYIKLKHMYNSARYYLYKFDLLNMFVRFDVIEVFVKNEKVRLNHIKQII